MSNLEIYCVTDKELPFLEKSNYKLAGVGKSEFSSKYIKCDNLDNIYYKKKLFRINFSLLVLEKSASF